MKIELTEEETKIATYAVGKANAGLNPNDPQRTPLQWAEDLIKGELDKARKDVESDELAKLRDIGTRIIAAPPELAKEIIAFAEKKLSGK